MHTLITWTDRSSPHATTRRLESRKNPILTLVQHPSTSFERVFLMYTPAVYAGTTQLSGELRALGVHVRLVRCDVQDATSYAPWFTVMTECMRGMDTSETMGLISAGPPTARAAWLALHATGEFQGTLVQVREGRIHSVSLGKTHVRPTSNAFSTLREAVAETERQMIIRQLQETNYNLLQTAKRLEIDRNTLKRKMRLLGIVRDAQSS